MRITKNVDIPSELLSAAREGRLVLFVGAGVSLNAPSNLPDYEGLARTIAEALGVDFDDSVDSDRFLGQLAIDHPLVKEQVRAVTGHRLSKPNANHKAIARLAAAAKAPVVSTNYDGHIEAAAAAEELTLGDRYTAPALPLGRDFRGIVYLHGSASRPASELVVTDDDFGRAYLTEGWARRFVQDLFENRTVLFVGYSHNDLVMTYLARGLPPSARARFVLTHEPESGRWASLRITPVAYPVDDGHAAVSVALDAWAAWMNMGLLDHHTRAKNIAAGSPPKVPEDADYLEDVLRTSSGARGFADVAKGYEWLRWAEGQDVFRALFRPGRCEDEASRVLAGWFVDNYVAVSEHSSLALGTVARLGPVVSEELQWELSRAVRALSAPAPVEARRWTALLTASLRTQEAESGLAWFHGYGSPLKGVDALPLLRRALVPRLVLREDHPWFPTDEDDDQPLRVSADIEWAVSKNVLGELWKQVAEGLEQIADEVLQIAEQALSDAYGLLRAFDPDRTFDPWSFHRSAIEPHEQNSFGDEEGTVVDTLRDAAAAASNAAKPLWKRWLASKHALFRRLGLHLVIESTELDADEKCNVVLDGFIYDPDAKHEVFRLLALAGPELTPEAKSRLLSAVVGGPPREDPVEGVDARLRRRAIFDRLEWLRRHTRHWQDLDDAIASVLLVDPNMGVRPHPDLDHYMTSGTWGGVMPLTVDEFVAKIREAGVSAVVQELVNLDYTERDFNQPTWDDFCRLLRETTAAHPAIGLDLLPAVSLTPVTLHHQLVAAVLQGWGQGPVPQDRVDDQAKALAVLCTRPELARAVSEALKGFSTSPTERVDEQLLGRLDGIAAQVWTTNAATFDPGGWSDSLMRGLNTWPGILAQYWLNRISSRWRSAPDRWTGLAQPEAAALLSMLDPSTSAGATSASILTGKLYFLFSADRDFTTAHVLPLFDPDQSDIAPDAWHSFLHEPRTPPDLLDAGFWEILLRSSEAAATGEDKEIAYRFWRTMASIAVYSTASVVDRPALIIALAAPASSGRLPIFADALGTVVDELDQDGKHELWSSWLEAAIAGRQDAAPGVQSLHERTAWGDLALELGTTEALLLTAAAPGPMGQHTRFHHLEVTQTQAFADLLVSVATDRLKLTTNPDWHVRSELSELLERVEKRVSPALLKDLAELAVKRGIAEALSWSQMRS
ncbi:SIR2 family protein [Microbacterium sp. CFBP 8790]|uniref:SIR2 family protein n=1 Tax=unclassified Microbacterium TaxID=2609290 RepID=UPI00177FA3DE|nr:SIR2 family protein [Microbacterium sp. CFBP 8801]MBD8509760.1 SIR2 family protein [Microbacterium sp. CFBP 8790]